MVSARGGELSDGEIINRLDTIDQSIQSIRTDMSVWRDEFVPTRVYDSDERLRNAVHTSLGKEIERVGLQIVDLQAEATRRARERRTMWSGIVATATAAVIAAVLAWAHPGQHAANTCVPVAVNGHTVCALAAP